MKETLSRMLNFEKEVKDKYIDSFMFLTKGEDENINHVISLYSECGMWGTTLMEYRRHLKSKGRGNVESIDILNAYDNKDIDTEALRVLLSEKFLEHISKEKISSMIKELEDKKLTIADVLHNIERRPEATLGRLLKTLNPNESKIQIAK